jgi:hypothetical protein
VRSTQREVWVALHPRRGSCFFYVFIKGFVCFIEFGRYAVRVDPREFYASIFHKGVVKILNRPSVMVIFSRFASYWAIRFYSRINTGHEWLKSIRQTISIAAITLILPVTPLGAVLGFKPLDLTTYVLLMLIVALYIITAEITKSIFYKRVKF